ncbi:MAG: ketoacyl-ACP synthase III [Coriobacteriales bacterium]|nr:ketoacyl-ACP synthase III [Coriobacteriales bacterium]
MSSIRFEGTGCYLPPKVLTNDDLAQMVDTSDEWIFERTGIKTRRINEGLSNAEMATRACERALCRSGVDPGDLCCLVLSTSTPDTLLPATACEVHHLMGLPEQVIAFDLNAACPGFLVALTVARGMMLQHPDKKALVVASEFYSDLLDWTDRSTCVLFGDGAGAAVLGLVEGRCFFTGGTREGAEALYAKASPRDGGDYHVVKMKGQQVFRFAVRALQDAIADLLGQSGLALGDIDHFVFHQANARIIKHVCDRLSIDPGKVFMNVRDLGNTSSASSAICLAQMDEQGLLKRGDTVLMVCFGAGLAWEGLLFEW